ncbi:hypothetical protein M422DRAFT_183916, partial [Sphaerobolus stellatus SS14]
PFYGYETITRLCGCVVRSLFSCPDEMPASSSQKRFPTIAHFIAYALYRTKLHTSVVFTELYLLSRLKYKFPYSKASSGHRLLIPTFMIAHKLLDDNSYENNSWAVVTHGIFSLQELNQMEREICRFLQWQLCIDPEDLADFEIRVWKNYGVDGTCPPFVPSLKVCGSPSIDGEPVSPLQG